MAGQQVDTGQGKITPRTAGGRPRAVSCARPQEFGEPGIGSATGLDKTGFVQFFFFYISYEKVRSSSQLCGSPNGANPASGVVVMSVDAQARAIAKTYD